VVQKRGSEDSDRRPHEEPELRMLIHQSQAGCVIGKAGGKLRDMRQDFGVEVKVYASCCPMSTDRIVRVMGAVKKVVKCLIYIVEMLRTVSSRLHKRHSQFLSNHFRWIGGNYSKWVPYC